MQRERIKLIVRQNKTIRTEGKKTLNQVTHEQIL